MDFVSIAINFSISLIASLVAVLIALWVERIRLPKLIITASGNANDINLYPPGHQHPGRWKFIRLQVTNKKMRGIFSWIPRYTAINCRAALVFYNANNNVLFSMKGRWASTPELAFMSPQDKYVKLIVPDTVSLTQSSNPETLDVIAQHAPDNIAYGWNNEVYLGPTWKNPRCRLPEGQYKLEVTIIAENGVEAKKTFRCLIDANYLNSSITEIN